MRKSDYVDRQSWSGLRRRRQMLVRVFVLLAAASVMAAFFAGYAWQSGKMRSKNTVVGADTPPDPVARAGALAAVDEAMRAKREKRVSGALAALERARRTDPSAPGIEVCFAELALGEQQFIEMRAAAGAAKKKNDHPAAAAVLLGVDKWMNRGASDREISSAADAASAYFTEATEWDFFNAPAWFFLGDVLRYAGREAEGRGPALSALHRFHPWDSSDIMAAKLVFASAEAGDAFFGGSAFLPDSPWTRAVSAFAVASTMGGDAFPQALVPYAAQRAVRTLTSDPIVRSAQGVPPSESGRRAGFPVLP